SGQGRGSAGFIRGFGINAGAIAQTISHDDHNIVVLGMNDDDMLRAVREIVMMQGGICLVRDGQVLARLSLPIAGLMSDLPAEQVARHSEAIMAAARSLGIRDDFDTIIGLGYMSLNVIPDLKITARGLFDVNRFDYSPVGL
ncbi:MAG: adenine deaminase, partial [Negativicutes bacterium]|nr:adenine deaminase [Negativicutes bacterium]